MFLNKHTGIIAFLMFTIFNGQPLSDLSAVKNCICESCNLNYIDLTHYNPDIWNKRQGLQECSKDCSFKNSTMQYANLEKAYIKTCLKANVSTIKSMSFENVNFQYANLREATLIGVDFKNADFSFANLKNSSFYLCDLSSANFYKADLANSYSPTETMHAWGSNMQNAIFDFANLQQVKWRADYRQASFKYANLQNSYLSAVGDITGNSKQSAWYKVDFRYANLQGTVLKPLEGLEDALFCHTIMPDGKENNKDC